MTNKADRLKNLLDKVQGMELGGGGFWKPKEGRSVIRILPSVGDMDFFFVEVGRHYKQRQYCPKLSTEGQEACPICELNEQLYQAGEKDAAGEFRAGRAFWMNIIDRANADAGPQIFTPGIKIFTPLTTHIGDPDYGLIYDEYEGFDIKLDRKGSGVETTYPSVLPMRNPSPLGSDDEIDDWLDSAIDLKVKVSESLKTYDELIELAGLQAYFSDAGDDEDFEPVNDEVPVSVPVPVSRRRRRSRE